MFTREKIFTVYEKPEAGEPAERVILLRDGFAFWAFFFGLLWLLCNRQWRLAVGYFGVMVVLKIIAQALHLSVLSAGFLDLGVQLLLGFHAYELMGWVLQKRGYRLGGILAAESEMHAQRRYDQFAA